MGGIAQQDKLLLSFKDHETDSDANYFDDDVKKKLIECVKSGTIGDVLIKILRNNIDIYDITTVYSWQAHRGENAEHEDVYSINGNIKLY